MSTISITTPGISVARPKTRLRITPRGRRVVLALAAMPLAAGIAWGVLSGGAATASNETAPLVAYETVTVLPGDTLWAVAQQVAPGVDPRAVIDDIAKLNGLTGQSLQIGQVLSVPEKYSN